jgi:hypothetical protein
MEDIPQAKKGNPIPGHFEHSDPHGCVTEYTYQIPLYGLCGALHIATHAVVEMPSADAGTVCADGAFDYDQGTLKNGSEVSFRTFPACDATCRGNPANAFGGSDSTYNQHDTFFSLGYGGYLILTFPTLIGGELTVYETTWGAASDSNGIPFPGSNWATYFTYEVEPCNGP